MLEAVSLESESEANALPASSSSDSLLGMLDAVQLEVVESEDGMLEAVQLDVVSLEATSLESSELTSESLPSGSEAKAARLHAAARDRTLDAACANGIRKPVEPEATYSAAILNLDAMGFSTRRVGSA